jgi:hypothetical protein
MLRKRIIVASAVLLLGTAAIVLAEDRPSTPFPYAPQLAEQTAALLTLEENPPSSPSPSSPSPAPGEPRLRKPEITGEAHPDAAGLQVAWAYSWDDAVAAAKKLPSGRILLSFVDEDCGECRRMDALVVPSTSFWAFTRDKIPLRVVRATPEGKRLTERFRIPEVPAWLVVTPDMVVSGAQIGSTTQQGWIDTFIRSEQGWATYQKRLDAEAADPADDALVFDVAKETFKRGGDNLAEPRFRRLAGSAKTPWELREQSYAYLVSIEMDAGRLDEAAKDLDVLLTNAKDPMLKQRAELRRADLEIARGRKDLAAGRLKNFKAQHPLSPLVPEADELLRKIQPPDDPPAPKETR